jgi:ArsR family transcriptional regulator
MTVSVLTPTAGPAAARCCAPTAGANPALQAERIATVAKAVADPLRVRVLDVLRRSEEAVCQCELIALFDIKQSLLSHHMRKLVDAGLVTVERRHRWAYYDVNPEALAELAGWLDE